MDSHSKISTGKPKSTAANDRRARQSVDDSRRRFLAVGAAGVVGLGAVGSIGSVTAATGENTLEIQGFGTRTSYSFTVGDNLSGDRLTREDEIVRKSAHGAVGSGKDIYRFDGPLYAFDFDRSGEINVTLNGEPAHVGQRPDHVIAIEGTGTRTSYAFTVSDNLDDSNAYGGNYSLEDEFNISAAEGAVANGTDAYTFDGPLYSFDFDQSGAVNVILDGKPAHVGNRPDHQLAIYSRGSYCSYDFSVTGSISEATDVDSGDSINGSSASGAVDNNGEDLYTYTGDLVSLNLSDYADVFLDLKEIDEDDYNG